MTRMKIEAKSHRETLEDEVSYFRPIKPECKLDQEKEAKYAQRAMKLSEIKLS